MKSSFHPWVLLGASFLASACASVKPPSVRVTGIHLDGVSITGARLDVGLHIRNVNPEDMQIERFEYEVKLNGQSLGRGFQSDPLTLGGFKEDQVISRMDVNFLKIPGVVKKSLERDRVDAEVKGAFYVRRGSGVKKIKFGTSGNVDLKRVISRDSKE